MAPSAEVTAEALVLVQAQAQARQQIESLTAASLVAEVRAFRGWYSSVEITRFAGRLAKLTAAAQKQTALSTDSFATRILRLLLGRRPESVGAIPVDNLRGVPLESVYGRLADNYRYLTATRGPESAAAKKFPEPTGEEPRARLRILGPDEVLDRVVERAEVQLGDNLSLAMRDQWAAEMQAAPAVITGFRRVIHPELSSGGVCGLCAAASTRIYGRQTLLPLHANCVPAGTKVAGHGVLAVTRRRYSGDLIVILTASGQELCITPQHPVLTDQGWIPAEFVNDGDEVVRHLTGHGAVGRGPDKDDHPPLVEDVWRAGLMQSKLRRSRMPLSTEDFHGDGSDGEVDVVWTDSRLARMGDVSFGEPTRELLLMDGHAGRAVLDAPGPSALLIEADGPSPHGLMSGGGELLALLGRAVAVAQVHDLAFGSERYSGLKQMSANHSASDSVLLGQEVFGDAVGVLLDDVVERQFDAPAPRFDPATLEFTAEGRLGYARLGRSLLKRLSGNVEFDRVVHTRRVSGTHDVFNLHTAEGWYSADGLIVSNCKCGVVPVIGEGDNSSDFGLELNNEDLKRLYKDAGSTAAADLKRTRYVVKDHGELGPRLASADDNFRTAEDAASDDVVPSAA